MPPLKPRHLSIFFLFALLFSIWLLKIQLAELAITSLLNDPGTSSTTIDIRQLGLNHCRIPRFTFSITTASGRMHLEALNTSLDYTPAQLSSGRVGNIIIEKLVLYHEHASVTANSTLPAQEIIEPVKIIAALRQATHEYIIFDKFTAEEITLAGKSFGALQDRSFHLQAANDTSVTRAELILLDQPDSSLQLQTRQLIINSFSEDTLSADFMLATQHHDREQAAGLELNIQETTVKASYSIKPTPLSKWLQPFVSITPLNGTEKISGSASLDFAADNSIVASLSANTDRIVINSFHANNATVKLNARSTTGNSLLSTMISDDSYVYADKFEYGDLSLDKTRIHLSGELSKSVGSWLYKGNISAGETEIIYDSMKLILANFTSSVSIKPGSLDAEGELSTANLPAVFDYKLGHSFSRDSGNLSVQQRAPLDMNTSNNRLSQLITPWNYPFDILSGSVYLAANTSWSGDNASELIIKISMDQSGGNYGELVFSGLTFEHEIKFLPEIRSVNPSKINLKHLDSGVIASNISTELTLEDAATGPLPQVAIQGLRGEIFDGSFSSDDFVFDLNRKRNNFRIKATNIDLAKIIETQQFEDLTVTGRIDGTIPIEIRNKGVYIENGVFVNDVQNGTIRYKPAAGTDRLKQNPLTGLALDALGDFRYSHLSADVNFTPDGILTVNLQLKGTSPELDTRRPVHININTEQNLLSLLKSLRYAEGVSAVIDKKVRRKYTSSKNNN